MKVLYLVSALRDDVAAGLGGGGGVYSFLCFQRIKYWSYEYIIIIILIILIIITIMIIIIIIKLI